jgi:TP53 regulating kinase-like protein
MKLLKKGAEADIYESTWNEQKIKCIIKKRKEKKYRNNTLDHRIRRNRTIRESEIISQVKRFGIFTPLVYFVNTIECTIYLQYVDGRTVYSLTDKEIIKACKEIGKIVAKLHQNGIMHGDLTTSNFILSKGRIFTIDFGLSNRTTKPEDHAIDLRLFKEILNSAHAAFMEKAWNSFLTGYKAQTRSTAKFNKIMHLVSVIEGRGRYATVV